MPVQSCVSFPKSKIQTVWNLCLRWMIQVRLMGRERADLWQSKTDFCEAFGRASADGLCFNGEPVTLNNTGSPSPPAGLCLEKIGNGSYLTMVGHPDGSNRAFFSSQPGKIWLATIPEEGSGGILEIDESNPFIDLTDEVYFNSEIGLLGMTFHPNFAQNGRFFASFICDKFRWPGCVGRCSCNSDVHCDPSMLVSDNGVQPCQYHIVVAEYSVNNTAVEASLATAAKSLEVRRILAMGLRGKKGERRELVSGLILSLLHQLRIQQVIQWQ
ncbi:HIPL1 protein-like isoform X2 [Manihot esculenta]|uniref:HIPL1 protein-like isoform X2 n=1 Tax=Manihot esculenta TaxID=3983 RepID=UPI001CC7583E|nr:HIPL1 protein-like isoform X2 [Manihot esculenta]